MDQTVAVAVVSSGSALLVAVVGGLFTYLASRKPDTEPTVTETLGDEADLLKGLLAEAYMKNATLQRRADRCEAREKARQGEQDV